MTITVKQVIKSVVKARKPSLIDEQTRHAAASPLLGASSVITTAQCFRFSGTLHACARCGNVEHISDMRLIQPSFWPSTMFAAVCGLCVSQDI
jgi:hypothetical protein